MRLFVAIDLSDLIRESLSDQIELMRRTFSSTDIRWVKPYGIHLTLKFLGETPDHAVDQINNTLGEISTRYSAFSLTIGNFGCFPNLRRPRVLWVGIQDSTGILKTIHHDIEIEFRKIGFKPETRPFKAHLTLGRIKKKLNSSELDSLARQFGEVKTGELGIETVREICLIRSILRPTGAEYTRLGTHPFTELTK